MENIQFVAFDVETASMSKPRFICQIGLTIVDNNHEIVETKTYLVQPPNNEIAPRLTGIHGISPHHTVDAPDFETVWSEIKHLFSKTVVAHNASFDRSVLSENLDYHDLDYVSLDDCVCTYRIFNRRLDVLCHGFDIDVNNHHDAGFDAECCAQFYINHLKGIEPDEEVMGLIPPKEKSSPFPSRDSRLSGDILKKDLTGADEDNPFYDKKIVITGTFSYGRKDLAIKLKSMGVDIDTSISKYTDIVLVGDKPGPAKMKMVKSLQDDGYSIKVIEEYELNQILKEY